MSAEIYEDDLAVYAKTAWHRKGIVIGHPLTFDEYIEYAQWPMAEQRQLYVPGAEGEMMPVPNQYAIVRTDNHTVLNTGVTEGRAVTQYHLMDDAVAAMLETGLATGVLSAGTLNHGAKGYVTLEFGESLDIPGYSKVDRYFTLADAHDGTVAASGRSTMGVVVCANTFAA
jgi:hypothetical protein